MCIFFWKELKKKKTVILNQVILGSSLVITLPINTFGKTELEGIFLRSKYINQVFVYGDSTQASLVAIVVPDRETMEPWLKEHNFQEDFETACTSPRVRDYVNKLLTFHLCSHFRLVIVQIINESASHCTP